MFTLRYGFNSCGHDEVEKRLFGGDQKPQGIIGINLGKNKGSEDAIADYLKGCSITSSDILDISTF